MYLVGLYIYILLHRGVIFLTPCLYHTTTPCCDRGCVCVWKHFVSASLHECWIDVMEMACPSQFVSRLDYAVLTVLPVRMVQSITELLKQDPFVLEEESFLAVT